MIYYMVMRPQALFFIILDMVTLRMCVHVPCNNLGQFRSINSIIINQTSFISKQQPLSETMILKFAITSANLKCIYSFLFEL